jgi:hypothetical protein
MDFLWIQQIYYALPKPLRAATDFIVHLIAAAIVIGGIELFDRVFWHTGSPLLFDRFPMRYLTDAMDAAVLVTFVWFGTKSAIESFRE